MKKVLSMFLVLVMCFSLSVAAAAKTLPTDTAQPYYETGSSAKSILYLDGSTATCVSNFLGDSDVTKIVVTQKLQVLAGFFWYSLDNLTCTRTVYSNNAYISTSASDLPKTSYRLGTTFDVTTKSGKTETITVYSDVKKVV